MPRFSSPEPDFGASDVDVLGDGGVPERAPVRAPAKPARAQEQRKPRAPTRPTPARAPRRETSSGSDRTVLNGGGDEFDPFPAPFTSLAGAIAQLAAQLQQHQQQQQQQQQQHGPRPAGGNHGKGPRLCRYCAKPGHEEAKCWRRQRDGKRLANRAKRADAGDVKYRAIREKCEAAKKAYHERRRRAWECGISNKPTSGRTVSVMSLPSFRRAPVATSSSTSSSSSSSVPPPLTVTSSSSTTLASLVASTVNPSAATNDMGTMTDETAAVSQKPAACVVLAQQERRRQRTQQPSSPQCENDVPEQQWQQT